MKPGFIIGLAILSIATACTTTRSGEVPSTSSSIAGGWQSSCMKHGEKEDSISIHSLEYFFPSKASNPSTFASITMVSVGSECDRDKIIESTEVRGTYTVSGNNVDIDIQSILVTPGFDGTVKMNKDQCPTLTWKVLAKTDVRGCTAHKDKFGKLYSIFKIEGNKLFTGDHTGARKGKSPETRPTEYDLIDVSILMP